MATAEKSYWAVYDLARDTGIGPLHDTRADAGVWADEKRLTRTPGRFVIGRLVPVSVIGGAGPVLNDDEVGPEEWASRDGVEDPAEDALLDQFIHMLRSFGILAFLKDAEEQFFIATPPQKAQAVLENYLQEANARLEKLKAQPEPEPESVVARFKKLMDEEDAP